jgi:hypothetical protein
MTTEVTQLMFTGRTCSEDEYVQGSEVSSSSTYDVKLSYDVIEKLITVAVSKRTF